MFRLQHQVQTFSQAQAVRHIRHQRAQVLTVQLQALKPRQRLLTQNYNRLKKLRHNKERLFNLSFLLPRDLIDSLKSLLARGQRFFYNEDITYRRDALRNRRKLRRYIITYDIVMTVLALISIGLVIFDLVGYYSL